MAYDDDAILSVLNGQSEGYLIHPNASAFVAAGFTDPGEVEASLLRLQEAGHAQEFEDVDHEPVWEPIMTPALKEDGTVDAKKDGTPKRLLPVLDPVTGEARLAHKIDEDGRVVTKPKLDDDGNEVIINHGFEITAKGRKAAPPKLVPDEPESSP